MALKCEIILVAPWYENYGKRIVKTPKLYFTDCGLAASLLGIGMKRCLRNLFFAASRESLVASEILKHWPGHGIERGLYYFRDCQGLEVDFMVDAGNGNLIFVEAKVTSTPMPGDADSISLLMPSFPVSTRAHAFVVCDTGASVPIPLFPNVRAVGWRGRHKTFANG